MNLLKNYITRECKPPTYLKHFETEEKRIILAHKAEKNEQDGVDGEASIIIVESTLNTIIENLDLTGNPLELDLQVGKETFDATIISSNPNSWLKSEELHIPVPLTDAIRFINHYSKNNLHIGDGVGCKIYCVCDGSDVEKTVLIGTQKSANSFDTFQAYFKGCFAKNDPAIDFATLKKEHLDEAGKNVKVTCQVMSQHVLKGFDLRLLSDPNESDNYGAILMDIYCKDGTGFNLSSCNISSAKLHIQTIAGHRNSPITNLWEDLLLVEKFTKLLNSGGDLDETILSEQYLDYNDNIALVEDTLRAFSPFTNVLLEEKVPVTNFDNFRPYNVVDHFWNILKRSKCIDDVRGNLNYIFIEAARDKSLPINIPLNYNGFFANMLRGVLDGTPTVPIFTNLNALECLIEFGTSKLKNDYVFILDSYNCYTQHPALEIFSVNCEGVSDKRRTVFKRRTIRCSNYNRLTLNTSAVGTALYNKQLQVLCGLHMSIQSILLLKEMMDASSAAFQHTPQYILNHFLEPTRSTKSFKDLIKNNLCELSLDIKDIDEKLLLKCEIMYWNCSFKSVINKTTVNSIYLLSIDPIFPPCIIKDYEYPDTEDVIFHSTRFLSILDSF